MKKIFCILAVFIAILNFFISIISEKDTSKYYKQVSFLENLNCEDIIFYRGDFNFERTGYFLSDSCSSYIDNTFLNTDIIMQNQSSVFNEKILLENEIVVSKNFLENNFDVGQYIQIKNSYNDSIKKYKIVDTIDSCYGIRDKILNSNKFVFVIGFSDTFINEDSIKISFITNEKLSTKNIILSEGHVVDTMILNYKGQIFPVEVIKILCKLFVFIFYFVLLEMIFGYKIRKHILEGRNIKRIYFTTYLKYSVSLIAGYLIGSIIYLCFSLLVFRYFNYYVILSLILIILYIITTFINLKRKIRGSLL